MNRRLWSFHSNSTSSNTPRNVLNVLNKTHIIQRQVCDQTQDRMENKVRERGEEGGERREEERRGERERREERRRDERRRRGEMSEERREGEEERRREEPPPVCILKR